MMFDLNSSLGYTRHLQLFDFIVLGAGEASLNLNLPPASLNLGLPLPLILIVTQILDYSRPTL
jgi:hypothetical protein